MSVGARGAFDEDAQTVLLGRKHEIGGRDIRQIGGLFRRRTERPVLVRGIEPQILGDQKRRGAVAKTGVVAKQGEVDFALHDPFAQMSGHRFGGAELDLGHFQPDGFGHRDRQAMEIDGGIPKTPRPVGSDPTLTTSQHAASSMFLILQACL